MEPSKEAIEATVQVCLHNDSNYPSRWVNKLLQAAYAIDFAALQQENARLKALALRLEYETNAYAGEVAAYVRERDRLAGQLAEVQRELEQLKSTVQFQEEQYLKTHGGSWGVCKYQSQLAASERKVGEFIEAVKKRAVVLDLGRDGRSDWCQAEAFKDVSKAYLAGRTEG